MPYPPRVTARLLVIDDDVQLARVLMVALDRREFVARVAADAVTGLEMIVTTDPDLVILDLGLPDRDGVDVVRELRSWSQVPVLILSGATDQRRRVEALDAGADDYVQKPFSVDELVARVRAVLRRAAGQGEAPVEAVRRFGALEIDLQARSVTVAGDEVRLTPTEWRLLMVLVASPGRLLSHQWILDEVWDSGHGDETKVALRAHVRSLRAKIGDSAGTPTYVRTESGAGYRWIGRESPVPAATPEPVAASSAPSSAPEQEESARAHALGTAALTHELNNALTALRVAVYLLRRRVASPDAGAGDVPELSDHVEEIVERVSALAVELELRAGAQPEG